MENAIRRSPGKLIAGVILVTLGILFTLENFGLATVPDIWKFWPLILVAIGLSHIQGRFFRASPGGHVLVLLGLFFLLRNFHVIRFDLFALLPLLLVALGLRIVFGSPRAPSADAAITSPDATVGHFAAFSGVNRRISSQEFQGGDLGAFCGGWDLDLRQAAIAGDQAVIDVFVWWGGGDIKVPADWDVIVKVLPVFGGVGDKTTHPTPQAGVTPKRLILTGTVVMGGVEVKN